MRILVLFVTLAFAVCASADDKKKVPVKRLDMASPMAQAVNDGDVEPGPDRGVQAQDYNSSRSNNINVANPGGGSGNDDNPSAERRAENRGFNSSRSNTSSEIQAEGGDYNSSRSNKTHAPALDTDSDGDSIDAVCGNGVDDDCDGVRVAPPANHNTTRSNKTSE